MNDHPTTDALRRAVAGATIERDGITASAVNLVLKSLQSGGRLDFTAQDVRALNIVLQAVDTVAGNAPTARDFAPRRAALQTTEATDG
jgi:hypothetical protein